MNTSTHYTGSKYQETKSLDIREIAKLVRKDIKAALPGIKVSVRIERYSMGQGINATIMDVGRTAIVDHRTVAWNRENPHSPYSECETTRHSRAGKELLAKVQGIVDAYNYDKSEMISDYHEGKFHGSVDFCCDLYKSQWDAIAAALPAKAPALRIVS